PPSDCLLWVVDDGHGLRAWQECRQLPYIGDEELEPRIREVIGCHECEDGTLYLAARWEDYEGPTWELE
ncbi:hypothetical protein B0T10DRAFT_381786, partial [Thelonectria olida]